MQCAKKNSGHRIHSAIRKMSQLLSLIGTVICKVKWSYRCLPVTEFISGHMNHYKVEERHISRILATRPGFLAQGLGWWRGLKVAVCCRGLRTRRQRGWEWGGDTPSHPIRGSAGASWRRERPRPKMNLVHFICHRTYLVEEKTICLSIDNYSGTNKQINLNQLKSTNQAS